MIGLIIILAIIAILIILFFNWFFTMKANGKCPICALKKITIPSKVTIPCEESYNNNTAPTPPMGWSSWNTFRNHIDQDLILETANAMINSGLAEAGYQFINLDDCWQSSQRDKNGMLQGDLRTFSMGIPNLVKEINALGLKMGIYSSNGTKTCEDMPGSLGNEILDAKTFASWGCEFFKYDFCHHEIISGDCPAIEKIEINSLDSDMEMYAVLIPDDAVYTGMARKIKAPDLPSGEAIGYINHGAGTATFELKSIKAGEYAFTVIHQKLFRRRDSYLQIKINDRIYEMFIPYGKGFSDNGRTQIIVELDDGDNIITIQNPVATPADSSYIQYRRMGQALKQATAQWAKVTKEEEKPIIYSICEWGTAKPWSWGKSAGNMWRTTHDIFAKWFSIIGIYSFTIGKYKYAGPGAWNDPDMLEVGVGKLTNDENKAHFSLWCMMAAPLMLGNDIRKFVKEDSTADLDNPTLKIITNKNLIAIDQDKLVKPAKRIKLGIFVDILARPLENGDIAICILNKRKGKKTVRLDISRLAGDEYLSFAARDEYKIHNLWTDESFNGKQITAKLPSHSAEVYRISIK